MKVFLLLFSFLAANAQAKVNVITTTTDLKALVDIVGKERVDSFSIAKGTQDPHQIEAKPSFMVKLRSADLVLAQGLELESAWIVPLLEGARNSKVMVGSSGYFELGALLDPIEKPTGSVSRAQGDVHPGGNPHFQLDPIRLGKAAVLIAEKLSALEPSGSAFFQSNATAFQKHMEEKAKEWQARIKKSGVKEVVSYHKTFTYFFDRFLLQNTLHLEPKPGIPPTASHLMGVISEMKKRGVKLVLIENFYDDGPAQKIRTEVPGSHVERLPVSVGGEPTITDPEALFERIVKVIEGAK